MSLRQAISRVVQRHGDMAFRDAGHRNSIPSPVRGWNTRDGLANMKPEYAVRLQNYFPEGRRVRLRRGSRLHASGLGNAQVESLFAHESGDVSKLFAVGGDGKLYDVTNSGAVGDALNAAAFTGKRWHTAGFGGRTIMVSGADAPQRIDADGTLAAAHGWTGIATPANLYRVIPFASRLMFLEKDTAKLWYGPVGGVEGELNSFDLSLVHPEGGNAVALGTLSIDGGDGPDDLFVIYMASGSCIVYAGTDISDANKWQKVGIYHVGVMVGDRGLVKLGADLIAITHGGYIPLRKVLQRGRDSVLALSDVISPTVKEVAETYAELDGWDAIVHTPANWLVINIPVRGGSQHVMNTQTGAWCEFTGMDAHCWARFKKKLYYGGRGGKVYHADASLARGSDEHPGGTERGRPITGESASAYHYFRSNSDKRFTMARSVVEADNSVQFTLGADVDFGVHRTLGASVSVVADRAEWNVARWNAERWGAGRVQYRDWQSIDREGTALSIRLRSITNGARISLYATDVIYERATGIL